MKSLLFKALVFIVCSLAYTIAGAQSFQYKAALANIPFDSFYRISITPSIVAKCKPGLADLRLKDNEGNIVPYFVQTQQPVFKEASFTEFPIIKNEKGADKQTHVVVRNTTGNLISELLLEIKNTTAWREVTISGSDDNERFFVISENIVLQNLQSEDGNAIQSLSFPPTRYKYYQVTILGKNVLPVNILRAGTYKENYFLGNYLQLPKPAVQQKDSLNKSSYVYFTLQDKFQIEKIDLKIEGPKLFRRSVEIKDATNPDGQAYYFTITPGNTDGLPVHFKTNKLLVIIHNEDSPPLKAVGANLWQLSRFVIAYLQKDKKYTMYFSNKNMVAPEYDLSYFADSAASQAVPIYPTGIETIGNTITEPTAKPQYITQATLWIIIIVTLLILLLVTFSLTRQVRNRKAEP